VKHVQQVEYGVVEDTAINFYRASA